MDKKERLKQDIIMLEQQLDELTEKSKTIHKESDASKLLLAIKCNSYTTLLAVLELHLDLLELSK